MPRGRVENGGGKVQDNRLVREADTGSRGGEGQREAVVMGTTKGSRSRWEEELRSQVLTKGEL